LKSAAKDGRWWIHPKRGGGEVESIVSNMAIMDDRTNAKGR